MGKMRLSSYIGATDKSRRGNWTWVDGSQLVYNNWGKSQPDHWKMGENCALIELGTWAGNTDSGWWNNIPCEGARFGGYICSYSLHGETSLVIL